MRSRIRLLVVAAILVLLSAGVALLVRDYRTRHRKAIEQAAADLLPDVSQRIQNFYRVKVDQGRKVWEVSAREAQYREQDETVVVDEPVVAVFLEDGRTVSLRGRQGRVILAGRELQSVELTGDIDIQLGEYALRTQTARYDVSEDRILSPGMVEISGADFDLRGEHMEVLVSLQRLRIAQHVHMTLWPRS